MAHHIAFTLGGLCIGGGVMGYAKARSVPSLVAGVGSGLLLLGSGHLIRQGEDYGFEAAFGTSALLAAFSAHRAWATRKPAMIALACASTASAVYYARWLHAFRK